MPATSRRHINWLVKAAASIEEKVQQLYVSDDVKRFILNLSNDIKGRVLGQILRLTREQQSLLQIPNVEEIAESYASSIYQLSPQELELIQTYPSIDGWLKHILLNTRGKAFPLLQQKASQIKDYVQEESVDEDVLLSMSLEQVIAASDKWHLKAQHVATMEYTNEGQVIIQYPPLEPTAPPDFVNIVPAAWVKITNEIDAAVEGKLMRHCVGNYGKAIEQGSILVVSLRSHNNQPLATLGFRENGLICFQCKAKNDADPTEKGLQQYLKDLFTKLGTAYCEEEPYAEGYLEEVTSESVLKDPRLQQIYRRRFMAGDYDNLGPGSEYIARAVQLLPHDMLQSMVGHIGEPGLKNWLRRMQVFWQPMHADRQRMEAGQPSQLPPEVMQIVLGYMEEGYLVGPFEWYQDYLEAEMPADLIERILDNPADTAFAWAQRFLNSQLIHHGPYYEAILAKLCEQFQVHNPIWAGAYLDWIFVQHKEPAPPCMVEAMKIRMNERWHIDGFMHPWMHENIVRPDKQKWNRWIDERMVDGIDIPEWAEGMATKLAYQIIQHNPQKALQIIVAYLERKDGSILHIPKYWQDFAWDATEKFPISPILLQYLDKALKTSKMRTFAQVILESYVESGATSPDAWPNDWVKLVLYHDNLIYSQPPLIRQCPQTMAVLRNMFNTAHPMLEQIYSIPYMFESLAYLINNVFFGAETFRWMGKILQKDTPLANAIRTTYLKDEQIRAKVQFFSSHPRQVAPPQTPNVQSPQPELGASDELAG